MKAELLAARIAKKSELHQRPGEIHFTPSGANETGRRVDARVIVTSTNRRPRPNHKRRSTLRKCVSLSLQIHFTFVSPLSGFISLFAFHFTGGVCF